MVGSSPVDAKGKITTRTGKTQILYVPDRDGFASHCHELGKAFPSRRYRVGRGCRGA
jgi:hypothetical protein